MKAEFFVILASVLFSFTACSPSEESLMESAINSHLKDKEELCFKLKEGKTEMPFNLQISWLGSNEPDPLLVAAQEAGILTVEEKVERRGSGGLWVTQEKYFQVDLTEKGREHNVWNSEDSSFCAGNLEVDEITDWISHQSEQARLVKYNVQRINVPKWARHEAFEKTYEKERESILATSKNGWSVVR